MASGFRDSKMPRFNPHSEFLPPDSRTGFSLLEVLVSSGILVIGLASVAALIPAATARLGEASMSDRAANLSANVFADIMARRGENILAASRFPTGMQMVAFGSPAVIAQVDQLFGKCSIQQQVEPLFTPAASNIGSWFSQDSLDVERAGDGLPATVLGFREELCWIATIAAASASPGLAAELTIVILKKPDADVRKYALSGSGGVQSVSASNDARRAFLQGCSYVLHINASPPKWRRVNSSWTQGWPANVNAEDTRLIFSGPALSGEVIALEHVVRVDSYPIYLD